MIKITEVFEDYDYMNSLTIRAESNGERIDVLRFHDGEPEDNNLMRNFNDAYKIVDLIKIAYEAGKNGEDLEFDQEEIADEE